MFIIKFCQLLDSNQGPLVLEATALPTQPPSLPNLPSKMFDQQLPSWLPTKMMARSFWTFVCFWMISSNNPLLSSYKSLGKEKERLKEDAERERERKRWTLQRVCLDESLQRPMWWEWGGGGLEETRVSQERKKKKSHGQLLVCEWERKRARV